MDSDTRVRDDDRIPVVGDDDANRCGLTRAAQVLDRKWHPVIVARLLDRGPLRFNELHDAVGNVTNKTLSESLADLEEKGLVVRTVIDDRPVAVQYSLTELGASLGPVLEELDRWGEAHTVRVADPEQ